jgi:hypothetical protein
MEFWLFVDHLSFIAGLLFAAMRQRLFGRAR